MSACVCVICKRCGYAYILVCICFVFFVHGDVFVDLQKVFFDVVLFFIRIIPKHVTAYIYIYIHRIYSVQC